MDTTNFLGMIRRLLGYFRWELCLIWPVVLAFVYAGFFAHSRLLSKGLNEVAAPVILGVAVLVMLARWLGERQPLILLLLVLDAIFLCRELHFEGTTKGVYVALFLLGIWTALWWRNIRDDLRRSTTTPYLLFGFMTYVLSQAVARRAFRGILPLEADFDVFRTGLEEVLENVAHLTMLFVALRGFTRKDEEEEENPPLPKPSQD